MSEDKKRKHVEEDVDMTAGPADSDSSSSSDSDGEDEQIVNVDFDYFDPIELDFHAIKNLLRQLFDADNTQFDLSGIADAIIAQAGLGSTIKTDGKESDPFALLSLLDLKPTTASSAPWAKAIADYIILKTQSMPEFNRRVRQLMSPGSKSRVGWVVSERLINMPTEVVPPMYKMLSAELESSGSAGYDYFFIISKAFTEEAASIDTEDQPPQTKKSRQQFVNPSETYYFHQEDTVLQKLAEFHCGYAYSSEGRTADSKRLFQDSGIVTQGQLILVKAEKLGGIVELLESSFPPF